jgi:hypothetical protein
LVEDHAVEASSYAVKQKPNVLDSDFGEDITDFHFDRNAKTIAARRGLDETWHADDVQQLA